ncbi:hypothetical protein M3Y97_00517000 [Aphelenchoides bicaudatus]|nr:hypothetical protein M3Y97_00517000 [Aphelenchoides bicaudatus]
MLSKAFLLFSCLFICQVNANLGQGYNNGNQYGEPSVGRHNNGNNGFGQGYSPNRNGNQGEGSIAYAVPGRSTEQGLGQGTYGNNQGQGTYGNNQGQGAYGNNQGLGQGTYGNNQGYHQNGYSGLGRSNQEYSGLGRSQNDYRNNNGNYDSAGLSSVPLNQQAYKRMKRTLGQSTQPHGLGQSQPQGLGQSQPQGLGQSTQPQGLGQSQPQGLGQPAQQPSLTQPGLKQGSGLGGSLRAKRYVEREPYSKSCNSYYGKFICYRLYEKDAAIPHEFTCWSTYLGKKNCTETENILYLDRRNVEVDASELDRQFYPNDRSQDTVTHRDQHRQRSDEFGAVEKNLHNRQYNDRELPRDSNHGEH